MDRMGAAEAPAATRAALVEAATVVFAESGYRNATVREICQRAGANVAAVNYHFGDKANLYREVLRHVHSRADEKHPLSLAKDESVSPERRLGTFVRSMLFHLLDTGTPIAGSRLMSREMMEPTVALDLVVREYVQPVADELRATVAGFLGAKAREEQIRACGMSIVSQCLFYHQCEPVIRKLFPDTRFKPDDLERLAAHITQFSIAGLKAAARKGRSR
jgi:TetR/AcrR family transcriptional regulator, regulator of cefoperazone and chloramphenicol sensitivity